MGSMVLRMDVRKGTTPNTARRGASQRPTDFHLEICHMAASFKLKPRNIMIYPRLHRLFKAKVGLEFRSPESIQCVFRM